MLYREVASPDHLTAFVDALWEVRAVPGERIRVLPDACTDLIALDGVASRILFNGPMTVADVVELAAPVTSGLRLRPGVLFEVEEGLSLDRLRDADVELVNSRQAVTEVEGLVNFVDALLAEGRLRSHPIVDHVLNVLAAGQSLAVAFGSAPVSERTVERLFRRYVGLSPRQTAKILRHDRVGRALRTRPDGIAELAAGHGYADQSHLTREFGALAGIPPARFVREIRDDGIVQDDRRHRPAR